MTDIVDRLDNANDRDAINDAQEEILALRHEIKSLRKRIEILQTALDDQIIHQYDVDLNGLRI